MSDATNELAAAVAELHRQASRCAELGRAVEASAPVVTRLTERVVAITAELDWEVAPVALDGTADPDRANGVKHSDVVGGRSDADRAGMSARRAPRRYP
jgi:hypothetical protein